MRRRDALIAQGLCSVVLGTFAVTGCGDSSKSGELGQRRAGLRLAVTDLRMLGTMNAWMKPTKSSEEAAPAVSGARKGPPAR